MTTTNKQKIKAVLMTTMIVATSMSGLTACGNDDKQAEKTNQSTNSKAESISMKDIQTESGETISETDANTIAVDDSEAIAIEALAMADEVTEGE